MGAFLDTTKGEGLTGFYLYEKTEEEKARERAKWPDKLNSQGEPYGPTWAQKPNDEAAQQQGAIGSTPPLRSKNYTKSETLFQLFTEHGFAAVEKKLREEIEAQQGDLIAKIEKTYITALDEKRAQLIGKDSCIDDLRGKIVTQNKQFGDQAATLRWANNQLKRLEDFIKDQSGKLQVLNSDIELLDRRNAQIKALNTQIVGKDDQIAVQRQTIGIMDGAAARLHKEINALSTFIDCHHGAVTSATIIKYA